MSFWYSFTNTTGTPVVVNITTDLPGTELDSILSVFRVDGTECDFSMFVEVACNADGNQFITPDSSDVSFTADPGKLYKIQVTGDEEEDVFEDEGPAEILFSLAQPAPADFSGAFVAFDINARRSSTSGKQGTAAKGLVVADSRQNQLRVFMSNGDGTFRPGETFRLGQGPGGLTAGDFNGDGLTDVAVANRLSDDLSILLGTGDGGFIPAQVIHVGSEPTAVAAGDFNRDGTQDLAVANSGDDNVLVLSGQGDGRFMRSGVVPVGTGPSGITTDDFDQDGRLDVAVSNVVSNDVTLLRGLGDGGFSRSGTVSVGQSPVAVSTADFDGDGRPELVTANFGSNDVTILASSGGARFRVDKQRSVGDGPVALATGTFLNPHQGLAVVNRTSGDVSIRPGDESGALTQLQRFHAGTSPVSIVPGDFNNDGRVDLAVLTAAGGLIRVLLDGGDGRFHQAQ